MALQALQDEIICLNESLFCIFAMKLQFDSYETEQIR